MVAVVKEDSERDGGRKGTLEQEDVEPGKRRRSGRRAARGGGKMRLRGKLGGQRLQRSEKKDAEKEAKKQERKELVLALKLSRAEARKAQKEEAKRSRLESKSSESETKRGRFSRKERKSSKSRSESRKVSRSLSKPRSSETRHLKVKKSRSESSKPNKKEKEPRFFKNRRDAKRSRSVSEHEKKETAPKGILKLKLTAEEKLAKRQARKELREAKKAEAAEIKITGYISQEEPKKKKRNAKLLIFSNAPKNPFRPKIRYGKIVHVPKAIRSMRAAAQRR